jgi:hypothetical protein
MLPTISLCSIRPSHWITTSRRKKTVRGSLATARLTLNTPTRGTTPLEEMEMVATQMAMGTMVKTRETTPMATRMETMVTTMEATEITVVGMTYGACHVPSYLSTGVLGVSTARRYEDRLGPEGRLCQQPAGVSTVEGQSRAMKTKAHQWLFR